MVCDVFVGYYCDSYALTEPTALCTAGYYCVAGSSTSAPDICPGGRYCPQGKYCQQASILKADTVSVDVLKVAAVLKTDIVLMVNICSR